MNNLVIGNDSWEGFQGMFVYYNECELLGYYYKINGSYYDATSLVKEEENIDSFSYHSGFDLMDSFTIDTNGSKILVINISGEGLYQQLSNRLFVEILPLSSSNTGELEEAPYTLKVPLPFGKEINGVFQELGLNPIDERIIKKFEEYMYDEENDETEVVKILNSLYENI